MLVFHSLTDLNIAEVEQGKFTSYLRQAHQLLVAAILVRLGFAVSISRVKGGPYDLLITVYEKGPHSKPRIIRGAVKTASKTGDVRFIGGQRARVNRIYVPGVKKYKYSQEHNDMVIGVDRLTLDLYLIPTRFLEKFGNTRRLTRLQPLRNNWDILLNWNEEFLVDLEQQLE